MFKARTDKKHFKELLKKPLFFMQQKYEVIEKQNNTFLNIEDHYFYQSTDTKVSAFISDDKIVNKIFHLKYVLIVVGKEIKQNEYDDSVTFSYHIADVQSNEDWIIILNSLISRSQNLEDNFPYTYILWFLNHMPWNAEQLKKAICQYDIKFQTYIFKWLQKICRCLSYCKQEQIKEVAHYFRFKYDIYIPAQITDALKYVTPIISGADCNLFDLIDHILSDTNEINTDSPNNLISLYKWFSSNEPLENYQLLKSIYPLVSHKRQLKIIQRYFHDVRLNNVSLDIKLIEQFKENDYIEFMRYRYCIKTPSCKINIANQLLCDCILTLNETHGKSFQSFNGILDFVISYCDITNPKIDLGLNTFLPCCNGGVVYNETFIGFIDYSIIITLDENKFTSENLKRSIVSILESIGKKKTYTTCKYDSNVKPLNKNSKCLKLLERLKQLDCITSATYKNRWIVNSKYYDWLNLFVTKSLEDSTKIDIEISVEDTSVEMLKESIYKIALNYKDRRSEDYMIMSKDIDSPECKLLFEYATPRAMRIYPRKEAYIDSQILSEISKSVIEKNLFNESLLPAKISFTEQVASSLNTILKDSTYNGEYFETAYDKHLLGKLRRLYYYKKNINVDSRIDKFSFLKKKISKELSLFCAPKLAEAHNQATNLAFFWCRGKECFHNNLDNQCLQHTNSWSQYTLFHLAEIMGYPKLHQVECGYEPDGVIALFIVIANKALKKFGSLKCLACGHLMYPVKRDNFDRNNYYSCINPTCSEYKKAVYLNYCYKCKKGLIDSRNTKQCPNGWYICPTCLSCCDDKQFVRLTQRYEISHLPIPYHIQSKLDKGHNNKGCYFCPTCGTKLDIICNSDNCFSAYCKSCNKTFNPLLPIKHQE